MSMSYFDTRVLLALANFGLCGAICFLCACRFGVMGPETRKLFRGMYSLLFVAAIASGLQPLLFSEWPGVTDLITNGVLFLFIVSGWHSWRDRPPEYATRPAPLDLDEPMQHVHGGEWRVMNFDIAFERLIGHEGGYVNDPRDPGGETNHGISRRAYPGEDIKGMTLDRARQIYRRDYWGPAGCDAVPDGIKFDLFDMAVNSGVKAAIRALQHCAGVATDGVLGPHTLQAVTTLNPEKAFARFNGARLALLAGLPNWPAHGRGWALRIATNLMAA